MPRLGKWWIGAPALAALVYLAGDSLTRRIEVDLADRAAQRLALEKGALDAAAVFARGRDVVISGVVLSPPARDDALRAVRGLDGARAALDQTKPMEAAHPFVLKMERHGTRVTLEGHVAPGEREALRKELVLQGLEITDRSGYAAGAPPVFMALARFAAARLGEMDPGVATLTDDALSLSGAATPDADLEKLIAAAKAPPAGARIASVVINPAPKVSPYEWSARKDGAITLEGFVPTSVAKARGLRRATMVSAGAVVNDETRVAAGAPPGDFAGAVDAALSQLGKLAKGQVALRDAGAAITGEARPNITASMIESELKTRLPEGFSVVKVEVVDGPASPFAFAAALKDGALTLAGHMPAAQAHDEIRELAGRLFEGVAVTDTLAAARGAPMDFERAVAAALPSLARLSSGRLSVSGAAVSLVGEAPFQGVATDIGLRLAAAAPQGYASTVQLTARDPGAPIDADARPKAIAEALAKAPALFEGTAAKPSDSAAPALDALALLMLREPGSSFEIIVHAEEPGGEPNRDLAKRRAQAVVDWLVADGLDPARLTATAVGPASGAAIDVVVK